MARRFYFDAPRARPKKAGLDIKSLLVRCPSTAKLTDTGKTVDQKRWSTAKVKAQKFTCVHCGKVHAWSKEDVILGRIMST